MDRNILKAANTFKHSSFRKKIMIEIVNDCLYRINSLIDQTNKDNKCSVDYKLPVSFAIPDTINESDFRLELYYHIVNILEEKGFTVRIKDKTNLLVISWDVETAKNKNKWINKLQSIRI